ncbi:MAG: hypothetical protein GMKNLPBB_03167 [Myxococcota bacterium]|nr:hypothetical protein [Myxococcota bacterium]
MPADSHYRPDPRFAALGEGYADAVTPARFPRRLLRFRNQRWAMRVGLGGLTDAEWETHFARFEPLPGNLSQPLALRYHGHQFQAYNPDLGDGRGFLFAQLRGDDGRLLDLGTKGSGQTPYSRFGDGRLTLKGGVREILAAELLEARGVNTSKTFSLFETGERLHRNDEPSPTRSSVLVRLSHSHIRFGTFERLAHLHEKSLMTRLLDYCLEHYASHLAGDASPPLAFFRWARDNAASCVASWMAAGFVHGVLNTDNMNITGESFDYGPWRFLPRYDPMFTAAYFDEAGLYAFGRQPQSIAWNLERFAGALSLIAPLGPMIDALEEFPSSFRAELQRRILQRLGLKPSRDAGADALIGALFGFLERNPLDYDGFFFDWCGGEAGARRALEGPRAAHYRGERFDVLRAALSGFEPADERLPEHPLLQANHPESLLIDEVESLWDAIDQRDDWEPLNRKIARIRQWGEAFSPPAG